MSESDALDIRITAGQAGDAPVGEEMIAALDPHEQIAQAAMDKAYDSNAIRAKLVAKGIEPVIPPKANRLDVILYDKEQYKQRNKVDDSSTRSNSSVELRLATKNSQQCSSASSYSRLL